MADPDEVDSALRELAGRLADVAPELRARHVVERTVSCRVPDLGLVWSGQLHADGLTNIRTEPDGRAARAQVRLVASSDDVLALAAGRLPVASAWISGRLRIEASLLDLLKLRTLL